MFTPFIPRLGACLVLHLPVWNLTIHACYFSGDRVPGCWGGVVSWHCGGVSQPRRTKGFSSDLWTTRTRNKLQAPDPPEGVELPSQYKAKRRFYCKCWTTDPCPCALNQQRWRHGRHSCHGRKAMPKNQLEILARSAWLFLDHLLESRLRLPTRVCHSPSSFGLCWKRWRWGVLRMRCGSWSPHHRRRFWRSRFSRQALRIPAIVGHDESTAVVRQYKYFAKSNATNMLTSWLLHFPGWKKVAHKIVQHVFFRRDKTDGRKYRSTKQTIPRLLLGGFNQWFFSKITPWKFFTARPWKFAYRDPQKRHPTTTFQGRTVKLWGCMLQLLYQQK